VQKIPNYRGRSLRQIISENIHFDSVGYTYRGLSWLDFAKRENNVCALQYAAHDARQAIEQLLFEEIVLSVGTAFDRIEYAKCKGSSTKLHKVMRRLNPDHEKLSEFIQVIMSVLPNAPTLVRWDHKYLMKHWRKISNYLHWAGEPAETTESSNWLSKGIVIVGAGLLHIWDKKGLGYTGAMAPKDMQPEIRECWKNFKAEKIDINCVEHVAHMTLTVLNNRNKA